MQKVASNNEEYAEFDDRFSPITINVSESGAGFDITEEQIIDYKVKSGDTILKVLLDLGTKESDIFAILEEMKIFYNPRSIASNDTISINYKVGVDHNSKAGSKDSIKKIITINSVSLYPSKEKVIKISRNSKNIYSAKEEVIKISRYVSKYSGTLKVAYI